MAEPQRFPTPTQADIDRNNQSIMDKKGGYAWAMESNFKAQPLGADPELSEERKAQLSHVGNAVKAGMGVGAVSGLLVGSASRSDLAVSAAGGAVLGAGFGLILAGVAKAHEKYVTSGPDGYQPRSSDRFKVGAMLAADGFNSGIGKANDEIVAEAKAKGYLFDESHARSDAVGAIRGNADLVRQSTVSLAAYTADPQKAAEAAARKFVGDRKENALDAVIDDQIDLAGARVHGQVQAFVQNRKSLQANLKFDGLDPNAKELPPSPFRDRLEKEAQEIRRSLVEMDQREAKVEGAIPERLKAPGMLASLSKYRHAREEAEQLGLLEPESKEAPKAPKA